MGRREFRRHPSVPLRTAPNGSRSAAQSKHDCHHDIFGCRSQWRTALVGTRVQVKVKREYALLAYACQPTGSAVSWQAPGRRASSWIRSSHHATHKRTPTSPHFTVKIDCHCTMMKRLSNTTQPSKAQQSTAQHSTSSIGLNMSGTAVRSCAIPMPNPGTSPKRRYLHVSTWTHFFEILLGRNRHWTASASSYI